MILEPARAKLNLALHVRARRPDGYHELETLFAFVAYGDEIRVREGEGFSISGPMAPSLSGEGDNLVTRAAARFAETFGGGPWEIELVKHLPVASGIGGGSADAAATLRALARVEGVPLDDPRLVEIADGLGSDVPACLFGRTALGKGRGEQLEEIDGLPGAPVLLVNPGVAVSTAEVFRRWNGVDQGPIPEGRLLDRALAARNDLEPPARELAPVIGEVLDLLAARPGVRLARMSGSGATCFALFEDEASRAQAAAKLPKAWWRAETFLV